MYTYLIEMLQCPDCRGELEWTMAERRGDRIEMAEARCRACAAIYPVHDGIGVFLTPDLPRDDLWEEVDSHLAEHLRQHPDIERQLMDVPVEALAPADRFFRALILDERGEYARARDVADEARLGLYTQEYLACSDRQIEYLLERLSVPDGPIVDLASGIGHLLEAMARRLTQPIVATDFSPLVLKRDRHRLEFFGLYERVSLLAFDARRSPFKDGAVKTLTTYQGLSNIREPGNLLGELRRIASGSFLVVSIFFPEEDDANKAAINEMGLSDLLFRRPALESFAEAGWQVEIADSCFAKAHPTPTGIVLEGARVDALPVTETTLQWCVILATR
ncbi:MAG: methyltransferase domain-containing protein, partial [Anaerolineae bacterium]|nr:methyltransferase domain-containing protein [Anaerolineae bacterium]NIN97842.1 methyltransferase domain-containing protein [Anaerolineae bacterium]